MQAGKLSQRLGRRDLPRSGADLVQDVTGSPFDNGAPSEPVSLSSVARLCSSNSDTEFAMKFGHLAGASLLLFAATACSDRAIAPTQPGLSASQSVASLDKGGTSDRTVNMMDACDHASFAAQNPPILCTRNGGVAFGQLIAPAHGPRFRRGVAQRAVADGREGWTHAHRGEQGRRDPHVHQGREVRRRRRSPRSTHCWA